MCAFGVEHEREPVAVECLPRLPCLGCEPGLVRRGWGTWRHPPDGGVPAADFTRAERSGPERLSGGWGRPGAFHPLPPIAGTIHERGGQSFMTSYGHTNTAFAGSGYRRAGIYDVGPGQAAGYGQQQRWAGYGQRRIGAVTAAAGERLRPSTLRGVSNGFGRERFGRERHEERLRPGEASLRRTQARRRIGYWPLRLRLRRYGSGLRFRDLR